MKNIEKLMLTIVTVMLMVVVMSCTDNSRARAWGGTETITLEPNREFVNITWKETQLWIVTKPMSADHVATEYRFDEKSAYGVVEGSVIIVETRSAASN